MCRILCYDTKMRGGVLLMSDVRTEISQALFALSQKKNIDRVTVKDLVGACGISRQTFYYHFQDLTEVVEWTLQQFMQRLAEEAPEKQTLLQMLQALLESMLHRQRLVGKLVESEHREWAETLLKNAVHRYLEKWMEEADWSIEAAPAEFQFDLEFYSYAITGTVFSVWSRRETVSIEAVAARIDHLMRNGMESHKA